MPAQTPEQIAAAEAAEQAKLVAEQNAAAAAEDHAGKVQVQFLRPLSFGDVDYAVGTHWVPEEHVTDNWFFDANAKEGNLVEVAPERASDGRPRKAAGKK